MAHLRGTLAETVDRDGRRCCTENFKNEVWALSPGSWGFLGGTDGIRATGPKHAIQNPDADAGFGLLTSKGPRPKLRANNPFVSPHRGFREHATSQQKLPSSAHRRKDVLRGRWTKRVRNWVLCRLHHAVRTRARLSHFILLSLSWESQRADPEQKSGPTTGNQNQRCQV